ncbi:glycosyltransferase [Nostoc sphaeroides CHAB 2801]|uniref:glycosyltransferase n=1 Tax=Nostoc sphaeroides TaxID=446679 RepID=UPI000E4A80B8|nr:glycosyltransferase [Nostoc sphaeroides]MCC5628117.1 glycosyltransferase [Nostoc sphaeroides CHAB 2801]
MTICDVITIARNAENIIYKTLKNVSSQNYPSINHIIIDGQSTDLTAEVIRKFSHTKNCQIYYQQKLGITEAFNQGLRYSLGDLVIFLNAGDLLVDEKTITNIVDSYNNHNWLWAFGETISVSRKGYLKRHIKQYGEWRQELFLYGNPICHQSTIFTRTILEKVGLYNETFTLGMDYDFNIRASLIEPPYLLKFPVSYYDTTGVSSLKVFQVHKAHSDIRKKYFIYDSQRNFKIDTVGFIKAIKRFLMIPFKLYL